jgi:hypothetical protein
VAAAGSSQAEEAEAGNYQEEVAVDRS